MTITQEIIQEKHRKRAQQKTHEKAQEKNIGEIYKPTIPKIQKFENANEEKGFFTCQRKCDMCKHSRNRKVIQYIWDHRKWSISQHISCTTKNFIYITNIIYKLLILDIYLHI